MLAMEFADLLAADADLMFRADRLHAALVVYDVCACIADRDPLPIFEGESAIFTIFHDPLAFYRAMPIASPVVQWLQFR